MKAFIVEEDVGLLMVLLQQLARLLRALVANTRHEEGRALRGAQMNLRRSSHSAYGEFGENCRVLYSR
jgi:hypothetical protein